MVKRFSKVQTPSTTNENVEKLDVSDETTDETVDTNKEVKTDNKPKTRKDLNLSKIFAIPEGQQMAVYLRQEKYHSQ